MNDRELCKKMEDLLWASCPVQEWSVQVVPTLPNLTIIMTGEPAIGKRSDYPERQFKGDILVKIKFNGKRPILEDGKDEEDGLCTTLWKKDVLVWDSKLYAKA